MTHDPSIASPEDVESPTDQVKLAMADLEPRLPEYRKKTNLSLFVLCALASVAIPALPLIYRSIGWASSVIFTSIILGLTAYFDRYTNSHLRESYYEAVLSELSIENTSLNRSAISRLYARKSTAPDIQKYSPPIFWIYAISVYLFAAYHNHFLSLNHSIIHDILEVVFAIAKLFGCLLLSLLTVSCLTATTRKERIDSSLLFSKNGPEWSLLIEDHYRNDLLLVELAVELEQLVKRIDSFTLESTLLGGLSFTGFIAIQYSDLHPISDTSWYIKLSGPCRAFNFFGGIITNCTSDMFWDVIRTHVAYFICASLIFSTTAFLVFLVFRIRFTEAYRHTENIFRVSRELNDREKSLVETSDSRRPAFTKEIGHLIERSRDGIKDLRPIMMFLSTSRNVGVLAFVIAVAICCINFDYTWFWIVILVFLLSSSYGYFDGLRRKLSFLSGLNSTILNSLRYKS